MNHFQLRENQLGPWAAGAAEQERNHNSCGGFYYELACGLGFKESLFRTWCWKLFFITYWISYRIAILLLSALSNAPLFEAPWRS